MKYSATFHVISQKGTVYKKTVDMYHTAEFFVTSDENA